MNTNNFYLVDKPYGISSFDVIRRLRKTLNIKKMGHTGTLDPLATGLLLIATNNYTKLIPYLDKQAKEYEVEIMLDGTSASLDLGEPVTYIDTEKQEYFSQSIHKQDIAKIITQHFSGKIQQTPPVYSALKVNGKRAYALARKGVDVELQIREAEVFSCDILEFSYPKLVLRLSVSAGTYIRSIAGDIGKYLETGGYVSSLRRTKFILGTPDEYLELGKAYELEKIDTNSILGVQNIFTQTKFISLADEQIKKLNFGLTIPYDTSLTNGTVFFVLKENDVSNIVKYQENTLIPLKKI